ncbi:MAG: hypothetical protein ACRC62_20945 [Microcoleus sp.]
MGILAVLEEYEYVVKSGFQYIQFEVSRNGRIGAIIDIHEHICDGTAMLRSEAELAVLRLHRLGYSATIEAYGSVHWLDSGDYTVSYA